VVGRRWLLKSRGGTIRLMKMIKREVRDDGAGDNAIARTEREIADATETRRDYIHPGMSLYNHTDTVSAEVAVW
jgi:hypothetical protein